MKGLLALAVFLLPVSALSETPLGDAGGCERWSGGSPATDEVTLLYSDRIEYFESGCDITEAQDTGNGYYTLKLSCSGEGDTWVSTQKVWVSEDENQAILFSSDDPNVKYDLRKCE